METTLQIKQNGNYKNVDLKPKFNKTTRQKEGGLPVGGYVTVEKVFAEGKEFTKVFPGQTTPTKSYSCRVKLTTGDEVSFWLNEKEHQEFSSCGGIGDLVRITRTEDRKTVNPINGAESFWPNLKFELV